MNESINIAQMQNRIRQREIQWRLHALEQMMKRDISRKTVRSVLLHGERIEDYPDDWPLPSALFLGWAKDRPIHVVAAFDKIAKIVYIVTAYEPTLDQFESDFRTRIKS
ncbi:MAG: hypothetical protein MAG431_01064 [Chloroflexi bacterium]|nr:hypothetical protein [Chloroflexota bacterium]